MKYIYDKYHAEVWNGHDFCVLDHVYRENADGEFVKVEF